MLEGVGGAGILGFAEVPSFREAHEMDDEDQPPRHESVDAAEAVDQFDELAAARTYFTELFPASGDPSPNDTGTFVPRDDTPGHVGVCLSGGGSRAFSAGLGQLRALATLKANGSSLLSQTRALSTVSGGGWIGIPFVFLPSHVSDGDFLGAYLEPSALTLRDLDEFPRHGIAKHVTSRFSIPHLAMQALLLHTERVPSHDLWQVLMGKTFLKHYGLYAPGEHHLPTQFFSYDEASLGEIRRNNPGLEDEHADLVAHVAGQRRPYLISLSSLSVDVGSGGPLLAPVHSTPFIAGMLSTPPGALDRNGHAVGGGAVWPFAFGSIPISASGELTEVRQSRRWSLTDALGTSSAAFAESIIEHMESWRDSPLRFAAALRFYGPEAADKLARDPDDKARMEARLDAAIAVSPAGPLAESDLHHSLREITLLQPLVPKYDYWSPSHVAIDDDFKKSYFTDGGSLENTGVASMLSYADIRSVIAFLNVNTPLHVHRDHLLRETIVVDECLPPLFGYRPYVKGKGYHRYQDGEQTDGSVYQHSQVFESSCFHPLLDALWEASKDGKAAAIVSQTLTTLENTWFNVAGGKAVKIVWVYLSYAGDWHGEISDLPVRLAIDFEHLFEHFPNYDVLKTELSARQVNLLSNFSSWMVLNPDNSGMFTALYADEPEAR